MTSKTSKRKTLWGHTCYGPHKIKIYKSFVNKAFDGLTYHQGDVHRIEINAEVFEQPSLLDETLLHECIHVIEDVHGLNWNHVPYKDGSCCQAVSTLGHGLAQMLRELVQY